MSNQISVVVHNGNFHMDDVVSYIILGGALDPYIVQLIRTRDPKEIKEATIVIDVGGEYDHERYRYDHHFNDPRLVRKSGFKYSSAGLIWKHYGLMFLENMDLGFSEEEIDRLWKSIDERIFEWIDRIDNGQLEDGRLPKNCITINGAISSFTPTWDTDESFDEAFFKASEWTNIWLSNEIKKIVGQIKAESLIMSDFENRPFDRIMVMDEFKPWQKAIFENGIAEHLDYIVFYDKNNDEWRIQCVPPEDGSFEKKRPLPKEWAGLRNKELSEIVGAEMVFCHPGRFIGGFKYKKDLPKIVKELYK